MLSDPWSLAQVQTRHAAPVSPLITSSLPLWTMTGGCPGAALLSVCLSFSISHPRREESSLGLGCTGEDLGTEWKGPWLWNKQLCVTQQTWVLVDIFWCVPHVSLLTLSWPSVRSFYSFISVIWPHNSIEKPYFDVIQPNTTECSGLKQWHIYTKHEFVNWCISSFITFQYC